MHLVARPMTMRRSAPAPGARRDLQNHERKDGGGASVGAGGGAVNFEVEDAMDFGAKKSSNLQDKEGSSSASTSSPAASPYSVRRFLITLGSEWLFYAGVWVFALWILYILSSLARAQRSVARAHIRGGSPTAESFMSRYSAAFLEEWNAHMSSSSSAASPGAAASLSSASTLGAGAPRASFLDDAVEPLGSASGSDDDADDESSELGAGRGGLGAQREASQSVPHEEPSSVHAAAGGGEEFPPLMRDTSPHEQQRDALAAPSPQGQQQQEQLGHHDGPTTAAAGHEDHGDGVEEQDRRTAVSETESVEFPALGNVDPERPLPPHRFTPTHAPITATTGMTPEVRDPMARPSWKLRCVGPTFRACRAYKHPCDFAAVSWLCVNHLRGLSA